MNGILNIHKPQGITSFGVVALIKRLSRERRVGHAGTLDPQATGVLPVCLGQATRITEYFYEHPKTYRTQIELGLITDTYDVWGKVVSRSDTSAISRENVEKALKLFQGEIQQTPPMFSAVKKHGRPLYELAREGITIERESRKAVIYSKKILEWQPPVFTLEVECGKGTYIRSLAHDLGKALGCGAIMTELVRTKYGPFRIENAITPAQLEELFKQGDLVKYLHPIDTVLQHIPTVIADKETEKAIRNGTLVSLSLESSTKRYRAYTSEGAFLAVMNFNEETEKWKPEKVFNV